MEAKDVFLHEFWTNCISGKKAEEQFYNQLKLILKYSLVSRNYYEKFIKEKEGDIYKQSTSPKIHGYSKNYISLLDPQFLEDDDGKGYGLRDILWFIKNPGAYTVIKRDWIENALSEVEQPIIPKLTLTNYKAFDSSYTEANYEFVEEHCRDWHDAFVRYEMEYVLAGEVKVQNY